MSIITTKRRREERSSHHYQRLFRERSSAKVKRVLCALDTEKTSQAESLKLLFVFWSTSPCLQLSSLGFEGLGCWLQLVTCVWGWQLFHQLLGWKQRAGLCLLLWELWRGNVGQGGWDNSHPWLGEFLFVFIAALQSGMIFWERLSLEHLFLPELQAGQLQQADSDCLTFQQGTPLPYTHGLLPLISLQTWGAAGKTPICSPFPSFHPNGCQALHFHRDENTQRLKYSS